MGKAIIFLIIAAVILAFSWLITVGVIYLICLCFSLEFSLLVATGIWLVLMLISSFFRGSKE